MTASTLSLRRPLDPSTAARRVAAGPAEGWLSLACVIAMVVALAWSIDDAAWIRGIGALTDFLPPMAIAGVFFGLLGAKVGWGRWRTHLVGATFAGFIVPVVAAGVMLGPAAPGLDPAGLTLRFHASADVAYKVWYDLAIEGRPFTAQWAHFLMIFGGLMWGTGQYAAFTVFGHRRPLDAVMVTGLLLLANMALTAHEQLHLLVLFTVGALFLLIRSHAFEEQLIWLRRRIGDPEAMGTLYIRGGAVFVAAAVMGSLLLTITASSAPLQGLWTGFPQRVVDSTEWLQRYLPFGGKARNPGATGFGPNANIQGEWSPRDGVAFVASVPPNEQRQFHWRVATYAEFDFTGWSWGTTLDYRRDGNAALLAGAADDPAKTAGRREVTITISPREYRQDFVIGPQAVTKVDQATAVHTAGKLGWFSSVELANRPDSYAVTAMIPILGDEVDGGLTENRLRAAGRDYPSEVRTLYTQVPAGTVGPEAAKILTEVRARARSLDPYDFAVALRDYLRDPARFTYSTNVTQEMTDQCEGLSTVECFAKIRTGYCQFYATTMAVLLRVQGIPARFVQGYLPGERSTGGTETVMNSATHAWVEAYFPGYGWVDFDPTGGGVGRDVPIPSGRPVPATPRPSVGPAGSNDDIKDRRFNPDIGRGDPTTPTSPTGTNPGPFIAIGVLLAVGVIAAAWAVSRRAPRKPVHPDQAWRSLASLARRLGFGPSAHQTVYEYAGVLGDAVPSVRPELATVARAKVEVAYGKRSLGDDRMRAIGDAYRSLRVALLQLAFRRRRPRPRRLR